ncbi:MAG: thiamine-phosphate kinase [Planctomycetota bacterium]
MSSEFDYISWIRSQTQHGEKIAAGIGDDAAVIDIGGGRKLLVTTDTIVEGVHFKREDGAVLIGRKALAVSISDIAAMGCPADYCVVAATLPQDAKREFADDIYRGLRAAADPFAINLIGGDVTTGNCPLSLTTTVFGIADGINPVLRSGAQTGNAVCVTGTLGGSLRGKHLRFEPRITAGIELNRTFQVTSMIDVSDGLLQDLSHLLEHDESPGADIVADSIPISDDAKHLAGQDGRTALDHALTDGEDFELLFTCAENVAEALTAGGVCGIPVSRIGHITGRGVIRLIDTDGKIHEVEPKGYLHRFAE